MSRSRTRTRTRSRRGRSRGCHRATRGGPVGPGAGRFGRLLPQALVVAALAGGTTAFVACDKSVRVSVDGVPRTVHTFADDVGGVLRQQELDVGGHDIVAPAPGAPIADGDEVILRYGRRLALNLDGERHLVWTTATTVDGALRQLGVRAEGAYLSTSRHARIERGGLRLDVWTERAVTFVVDGRRVPTATNAATVRQALAEAGIVLGRHDTTSVPLGSFPREGQTISVLPEHGAAVGSTREHHRP